MRPLCTQQVNCDRQQANCGVVIQTDGSKNLRCHSLPSIEILLQLVPCTSSALQHRPAAKRQKAATGNSPRIEGVDCKGTARLAAVPAAFQQAHRR